MMSDNEVGPHKPLGLKEGLSSPHLSGGWSFPSTFLIQFLPSRGAPQSVEDSCLPPAVGPQVQGSGSLLLALLAGSRIHIQERTAGLSPRTQQCMWLLADDFVPLDPLAFHSYSLVLMLVTFGLFVNMHSRSLRGQVEKYLRLVCQQ